MTYMYTIVPARAACLQYIYYGGGEVVKTALKLSFWYQAMQTYLHIE